MCIFSAGPELWNVLGERPVSQHILPLSDWSHVFVGMTPSSEDPAAPPLSPADAFDRAKHAARDADTRSDLKCLYQRFWWRTLCWVIWWWYCCWSGWQTKSRARGCHRPQTGHPVGICWPGLHLTLLDWRLIYRTTFLSVRLSAHVCTCVPLCLYTHPEGSLSYQPHWAFISSDIFCHSVFKPNTWLCALSPHCGTLRGLTYATCQ